VVNKSDIQSKTKPWIVTIYYMTILWELNLLHRETSLPRNELWDNTIHRSTAGWTMVMAMTESLHGKGKTRCFLVSTRMITLRGLPVDCRPVKKKRQWMRKKGPVRGEQSVRFHLPETAVRFHLPGRAVKNPGARIQDREDNVSSLSGVQLCNQELAPQGESPNKSSIRPATH
jgi:hypothetical protein